MKLFVLAIVGVIITVLGLVAWYIITIARILFGGGV